MKNGGQSTDVWHRVTGDVKPEIPRPVSLLALEVYEPPTSPIGSAATLTIDSILAVDATGTSTVISDFVDSSMWHPMATSIADDSRIRITDDGGDE